MTPVDRGRRMRITATAMLVAMAAVFLTARQFEGLHPAVCGIGRPSGRRNSAVTANQSARPPTIAASAKASK